MNSGEPTPPRKHHYVPQHCLKRFSGDEGILWCYDFEERKIYPASPGSAACQRDLYSVEKTGGIADHSTFEWDLRDRVDGHGHAIIERLLNREHVGSEILHFFRYVSAQLVRTPSFLERMKARTEPVLNEAVSRMPNNPAFRERVTASIVSSGGTPEDAEKMLQFIKDGNMAVTPTNGFLVPQAFALIDSFAEIMMEMRWRFMEIDDSDQDLFIGDHPVLMLCPDGDPVGLRHPDIDLVLPLSRRIVAIGTWNGEVGYGLLVRGVSQWLNEEAIRHARRFIYGSTRDESILSLGDSLFATGPQVELEKIVIGKKTLHVSRFVSRGFPRQGEPATSE